MGNDLSLLYKYQADESDTFYAKRYLEDAKKSTFLDSIRDKTKSKLQQDPNYKPKKITEPVIIQEAFSQYLLKDKKDKLNLVLEHPAISKEDLQDLLELSVKYNEKSFYVAFGGSAVSYLIYKKFIERHHFFYNFFRAKSRFRGVDVLKKVFGGMVLFYSWFGVTSYFYKEKLKREVGEKGYYKKYFVDPDSVYIEQDI